MVGMTKALQAGRYRSIPALLRELRESAGLTQRELARLLGSKQPLVHKTEVGERRADITEFLDWCLACGADPEAVFRRLVRTRRPQ